MQPYSAPVSYPSHGPLHALLARLITEGNVEQLGFLDWQKVKVLVNDAFHEQNPLAARLAMVVAQWIILGQRFGVKQVEHSPGRIIHT